LSITVSLANGMGMSFAGPPGAVFEVWETVDLSQPGGGWNDVGEAVESPPAIIIFWIT
jgi:hypothetical protein